MASTTFTYTILTGSISTAGSIKNWGQYSLLPAAQILEEAQQYIYQRLRIQDMLVTTAISIADDGYTHALPDDFLDPSWCKLDGDTEELDYVQENLLKRFIDEDGVIESGRPARWSIFDNLMQFDVANDAGAALAGDLCYYKFPALLGSAIYPETNFLTDRFGKLLREACVAGAYAHRRRPETGAMFLALDKSINEANAAADMRRRGQIMR